VTDDGPPASPLWRVWQGTSRANRLLAGGAVVAVLLAGGAAALLTGEDEDEPISRTTTAAASATPSASASASASASTASPSPEPSPTEPTPEPTPPVAPPVAPTPTAEPVPTTPAPTPSASSAAPAELQLNGDDLGVTSVGAPYADAVAAVTAVLGPPVADPASATACVGAGEREVEWAGFRLAVTDGAVSGWSSTDGRLSTPSGIGIGTTITQMQEVYGDRLELYDANPDGGPGFAVTGVQLGGTLSGPTGDDRVTGFYNRACSPP